MVTTLASDADILRQIEAYCGEQGVSVTTFGRRSIGDGNLVADLRAGKRSLTLKTANRIIEFIAAGSDTPVQAAA